MTSFSDVVHAVDLENSIRYALTVEIPTQQFLDEAKMKAIYQYLEIIIRYLPLRENIIKFLKALREWPIQMDLRTMKSTDFSDKVTELMSIHRPFDATPEEYIGCKGSQPHFRGNLRQEIPCLPNIVTLIIELLLFGRFCPFLRKANRFGNSCLYLYLFIYWFTVVCTKMWPVPKTN